jgi:hypothetical protein
MEQLGSTISLEEGNPQDFELDAPDYDDDDDDDREERTSQFNKSDIAALAAQSSNADTLEAEFPAIDVQLRSPEAARQDLERLALGELTPIEARVSRRPALSTNAVDLITASRTFSPKSFAELLDASLSLK